MAKRGLFGRIRDFFLGPKEEPPKPVAKVVEKKPLPTTRPPRPTRSKEEEEARKKARERKTARDRTARANKVKLADHFESIFGNAVDSYGNPNFNRETVEREIHKFDDNFVTRLLTENDPEEINDLIREYKTDVLNYYKAEPLFYH